MGRPTVELADIVRRYGDAYCQTATYPVLPDQLRVLRAVAHCRTAALGGHVEACGSCGQERIAYNSCRNRHCAKCQSLAKAHWLAARQAELLPVPYAHVVFTLPQPIAAIASQNKTVVYGLLFRTAAETLRTIAADPKHLGAEVGFTAVLHTWSQTLLFHPHLHCVVPAGGLAPDGQSWVACRPGFFLPVRVLSRLFRRLFLEALQRAFDTHQLHFASALAQLVDPQQFTAYLEPVRHTEWVVYAKRPFGSPQQVLDYLGRYTHRVAISNHRLVKLEHDQVSFHWRDSRHHNKRKLMTLPAEEFLRRFLLHILPMGFQRIRHYGFLGNRYRQAKLAHCRALLAVSTVLLTPPPLKPDYRTHYQQLTGRSLTRCPACQADEITRVALVPLVRIRWPTIWEDTS